MNIIDELIKSRKIPALFIGSGISKRYLNNYPSWEELLKEVYSIFDESGITYISELDELKRENYSLFNSNKRLATQAEKHYNKFFYNNLKAGKIKIDGWVKDGESPFKHYIKERFETYSFNEKNHLKREIGLLKNLANKTTTIFTTNYDNFLKNEIFPNYDVYYKQSDLFLTERTNIMEIYKLHGSIERSDSLIITEKDYDSFDKNSKLIVAKMLMVFSESPIIFLGYSLTDENICKIILDFLSCLNEEQLKSINKHFIFVEYKKNEVNLLESNEVIVIDNKSIPITKISTDNFSRLFKILNNIEPGIPMALVKKTRSIIKNIVDTSIKNSTGVSKIFVTDNIEKMNDDQIAIAIGRKDIIRNNYIYSPIPIEKIYEDILYDNQNFDSLSLVTSRLSKVPKQNLIPIFKYTKDTRNKLDTSTLDRMEQFLCQDSYDNIFTTKIRKSIEKIPEFNDIKAMKNFIKNEDITKIDKCFKILSKSIVNFSNEEILDFCKYYFHISKDDCLGSTFFKRCVKYYDMKVYK